MKLLPLFPAVGKRLKAAKDEEAFDVVCLLSLFFLAETVATEPFCAVLDVDVTDPTRTLKNVTRSRTRMHTSGIHTHARSHTHPHATLTHAHHYHARTLTHMQTLTFTHTLHFFCTCSSLLLIRLRLLCIMHFRRFCRNILFPLFSVAIRNFGARRVSCVVFRV
jgi:hypothetical protein